LCGAAAVVDEDNGTTKEVAKGRIRNMAPRRTSMATKEVTLLQLAEDIPPLVVDPFILLGIFNTIETGLSCLAE
jgi:hypothetical protein